MGCEGAMEVRWAVLWFPARSQHVLPAARAASCTCCQQHVLPAARAASKHRGDGTWLPARAGCLRGPTG